MKILLINDYHTGGGAEGVFRMSIDLLLKNNYEVDSFVGNKELRKPDGLLSYLFNTETANNLKIKLNHFKPDIVHIHNYYHYLSPSIFRVIKEYKNKNLLKVVFTAHDYHLICPSSGMITHKKDSITPIDIDRNSFKYWVFKRIDHRGLKYDLIKKIQWIWAIKILKITKQIDSIISPSYFLKSVFEKNSISTPIVVVRNPFIGQDISKEKNKRKESTKKVVKLLFIGRLSKEKGLIEFLHVLNKSKIKNLSLDVLGTGEELVKIEKYITEKELSYVKLHGHQTGDALRTFLINSNVLVLPSVWYENAPLSIIEAASYGNIIMSSNLGGIKELTELTKNYILMDNWDIEFENGLEKLKIKEPNYIVQPELFNEDKYILQLDNIYRDL